MFPSGHAEGKLVLAGPSPARRRELEATGQILFRWVTPDGSPATYPWNPNGSEGNVAGLTNPEGNVFGLMPHPERGFRRALSPDWTRTGSPDGPGDGYRFLDAVLTEAVRRA
jgi:phosphoribosylformylglycinamidine synthase